MARMTDCFTGQLTLGALGLIGCLAFYLVWWCLVFKPQTGRATVFSTTCIVLAVLFGIAGLALTLIGIGNAPATTAFPNWWFAVGGLVAYVVLMFGTYLLFKRPVTTELFLIVGFAALELSVVHTLYATGTMGMAWLIALLVLLAVIEVASLVGYVLYYNLDGMSGYIDGMVPLAAGAVFLLVSLVPLVSSLYVTCI